MRLRLLLGLRPDVVGQPLRRHQRGLQVLFVLAVLVERRLHLRELLAQAIRLAERLLVVVGDGGEERRDLDLVEAAKCRPESLLAEIEGLTFIGSFSSGLPGVSA